MICHDPRTVNSILEAALAYFDRGLMVIPMRPTEKRPAVRKWKQYQTWRPRRDQIRRWFRDYPERGVAVIFGEISGDLGSRDFDDMASYELWASQHPILAQTLPTVATRRGRHVYFRADPHHVAEIRRLSGKPDGIGAISCGDGELRVGVGCYSLLPPSPHPLNGHVYEWLINPGDSFPEVDICDSGLFDAQFVTQRDTEGHRRTQRTQEIGVRDVGCVRVSERVETAIHVAITATIPKKPGMRHRQIFELARALKAIPALAAQTDPQSLKPHVRKWHKLALPFISTKAWEETWLDFQDCWERVKYPLGQDPIDLAKERALGAETPQCAFEYDSDELRLLVAICRELQREAGDAPFYLGCRTAGRLVGVDYQQAARWLRLLRKDRVLQVTKKGTYSAKKSSEYRYLADP